MIDVTSVLAIVLLALGLDWARRAARERRACEEARKRELRDRVTAGLGR